MRRDVGALRHVAKVAEVALVDDLRVIRLLHAVDLHGGRLVHQVEQGREGGAQAYAAPAAMADVEDALELLLGLGRIPELGAFPVERMAGGCL
jgi:hypothetical protein